MKILVDSRGINREAAKSAKADTKNSTFFGQLAADGADGGWLGRVDRVPDLRDDRIGSELGHTSRNRRTSALFPAKRREFSCGLVALPFGHLRPVGETGTNPH
jgi:hypothetical protein